MQAARELRDRIEGKSKQTVELTSLTLDAINEIRYAPKVIKSYRGKVAQQIHSRQRAPRFSADVYRVAQRKLLMLDAATALNDLMVPPGNRLEKLHGIREGEYSIRINDQWRVCFNWRDGDAHDVEVTDYH
ncbi:MAG: toxin HigB [Blastocatellia bacterium]